MKHPEQQEDRVKGRIVGIVALAALGASVIGVLVAWALGAGSLAAGAQSRDVPVNPAAIDNAPYGVAAPGIAMARQAEAYLSSYGWVDRERGIVHVPIEVAIEIYLARRAASAVSARTEEPR